MLNSNITGDTTNSSTMPDAEVKQRQEAYEALKASCIKIIYSENLCTFINERIYPGSILNQISYEQELPLLDFIKKSHEINGASRQYWDQTHPDYNFTLGTLDKKDSYINKEELKDLYQDPQAIFPFLKTYLEERSKEVASADESGRSLILAEIGLINDWPNTRLALPELEDNEIIKPKYIIQQLLLSFIELDIPAEDNRKYKNGKTLQEIEYMSTNGSLRVRAAGSHAKLIAIINTLALVRDSSKFNLSEFEFSDRNSFTVKENSSGCDDTPNTFTIYLPKYAEAHILNFVKSLQKRKTLESSSATIQAALDEIFTNAIDEELEITRLWRFFYFLEDSCRMIIAFFSTKFRRNKNNDAEIGISTLLFVGAEKEAGE